MEEKYGYDFTTDGWYTVSFTVSEGSVGSWPDNGLIYGNDTCYFVMGATDITIHPRYNKKASLKITNGSKSGITTWCDIYSSTQTFSFVAPEEYYYFTEWSGDTEVLTTATSSNTRFHPTLAQGNATYSVVGECEYVYDPIYWLVAVTYGEFDESGSGIYSASILQGSERIIVANDADEGYVFLMWEGDIEYVTNVYASTTTVIPYGTMTINASYYQPNNPTYYKVTVINGEANGSKSGDTDGTFAVGSTVTLTADDPLDGYVFWKWYGDSSATGLLSDMYSSTTTFTMPNYAVTYTAMYLAEGADMQYTLTVNYGTGSGNYSEGEEVAIEANEPSSGFEFSKWLGTGFDYVTNPYSSSTTVVMGAEDITLTATYTEEGTYQLIVNNGYGTGEYTAGTEVALAFNLISTDDVTYKFLLWMAADSQYNSLIADQGDEETTFTMPAVDGIEITALYSAYYKLTVNYGEGSGSYLSGKTVTITANDPADGYEFDCWIGNTDYVADIEASTTTITMPETALEITATYKEADTDNDVGSVLSLENDEETLTISIENVTIISGKINVGMIITDDLGNISVVTEVDDTTITVERKFNS